MILPFIMLASLLALVPAFAMLDEVWTIGAVSATLAGTLLIIAFDLPDGGVARLKRLLQPILIVGVALPALWMILQALPMPVRALINPIWLSASSALHQRLVGAITVDVGATLLSLAQYCAVVAAAFATTAIALDRQRAKHIFHILVAIATLVAARQIVLEIAGSDNLYLGDFDDDGTQSTVVEVIGVVLSCAMAVQAIEKLQGVAQPGRSGTTPTFMLSAAVLSLFICAGAILIRATPDILIAALFGAGIVLAVFAIRQWHLGPWGIAGLGAVAAIALLCAFAALPAKNMSLGPLAKSQTATERMLSDLAPIGSGAGTFKAMLPIYRDISAATSHEHPTAAAKITIEMGPVFFGGLVIIALLGGWILFNRALSRGHDYIYAAAGAGALISLPIMFFLNGGVLHFGAALLIAAVCGLALAQSLGGAAREVAALEVKRISREAKEKRNPSLPTLGPALTPWLKLGKLNLGKTWPQLAMALFGLLLTMQAAWILSAELAAPRSGSDDQNASWTDPKRDELRRAASLGMVRGDLWAESAFAMVPQPWTDPSVGLGDDKIPERALSAFSRTLRYSPHRSDAWLMLAALASRYKLAGAGYDAAALLKMSYYTAPSELALLPLRLHVALGDDATLKEPELREMIKRDVSLVLLREPALRPALVAAYRSASVESRLSAENLISEVDPGYVKTIRAQYRP